MDYREEAIKRMIEIMRIAGEEACREAFKRAFPKEPSDG